MLLLMVANLVKGLCMSKQAYIASRYLWAAISVQMNSLHNESFKDYLPEVSPDPLEGFLGIADPSDPSTVVWDSANWKAIMVLWSL